MLATDRVTDCDNGEKLGDRGVEWDKTNPFSGGTAESFIQKLTSERCNVPCLDCVASTLDSDLLISLFSSLPPQRRKARLCRAVRAQRQNQSRLSAWLDVGGFSPRPTHAPLMRFFVPCAERIGFRRGLSMLTR
jgi:hypothetical protein